MSNNTPNARRAQHRLRILIVGGSVAGLSAAYTLSRAGHQVTVFEKSDGAWKGPSSLARIPPNMAFQLNRWGITSEEVVKQGGNMEKVVFKHASTDTLVHILEFSGKIQEELRAPFLYLRYADFCARLVKLATDAGAEIRHSAEVVHVDPQRPVLHLASGETCLGDLIVGADGIGGIVQSVVTGEEPPELNPTRIAFNITVPGDKIQNDCELTGFLGEKEFIIWMSEHSCLLAGHIASTDTYHLILVCPLRDDWQFERRWDLSVPLSQLNINLEGFDACVQRLVAYGEQATPIPYSSHEPVEDWIHEDGKVLVIGNAAAAYPSPGVYGSCVAVEDAEILGILLGGLRHATQLPALLGGFEELRMTRAGKVAKVDEEMLDAWTNSPAPAGPISVTEAVDEEALAKQWEQFFHMCGYNVLETALYDATETAEEWLAQWPGMEENVGQVSEPIVFEKEVAAQIMA